MGEAFRSLQTRYLFLRVVFVKCEPTLKGLGIVSALCELSQQTKGQVCFGRIMLVSDP